jgi:hypothetical protein
MNAWKGSLISSGKSSKRLPLLWGKLDRRTLQPAGKFAREENVARLRAAIGFHGSKTFGQLQMLTMRAGAGARSFSRSPSVTTKYAM